MVPAELQQLVSDALGVPFATVAMCARRLREAGLITRGGRGRSAPKMGFADAARLTVAVCVSLGSMEADKELSRFLQTRPDPGAAEGSGFLDFLPGADQQEIDGVNALMITMEAFAFGDIETRLAEFGATGVAPGQSLYFQFKLGGCPTVAVRSSVVRRLDKRDYKGEPVESEPELKTYRLLPGTAIARIARDVASS